jgi:membrane glycosyltransferase
MSNQKKIIWLVLIRNLIYLYLIILVSKISLLENTYGNITVKGNASVLLSLKLEVLKLIPLYYFMLKIKEIVVYFLLGENIWKWRLQSHIDDESFAEFDVFMDKTIQYLASSSSKKALVVSHESFITR